MPTASAPFLALPDGSKALVAIAAAALVATVVFLGVAWRAVSVEAVAAWQESQEQAVAAQAAHLGISLSLLQAVANGVDTHALDSDDPDGWISAQVARSSGPLPGLRLMIQGPDGAVVADSNRAGPRADHPHPDGLSRDLVHCEGCDDNGFMVASAPADAAGRRAVAQIAPIYFSQVLREPWSWVMDARGMIIAHADPYQVGTRPFDADRDDPALTRMRRQAAAGISGAAMYQWTHDDGSTDHRLAAFAPIPGGPPGWAVASSDTREAAFENVDHALSVLAGGTAAALFMAGALGGLVVVVQRRAATAREAMLHERVSLTQAAAHSERLAMLGTMTAGVAHDLRSPLSALQIAVELLQETDDLDERDELLADSRLALDRLRRFSGDLTRFSRGPDAKDTSSEPCHCVQVAVRLLGPRVRSGKDLRIDLPDRLPRVGMGEQRLSQVLMNLLDNGAQVAHRIDVGAASDGQTVRLWVEDTGPGIDPAVATTLFDAFVTTKPAGEGTGLGLYLCRRFVEEAGGTLTVQRGALGGARFEIAVPVVSMGEAPAPTALSLAS